MAARYTRRVLVDNGRAELEISIDEIRIGDGIRLSTDKGKSVKINPDELARLMAVLLRACYVLGVDAEIESESAYNRGPR